MAFVFGAITTGHYSTGLGLESPMGHATIFCSLWATTGLFGTDRGLERTNGHARTARTSGLVTAATTVRA